MRISLRRDDMGQYAYRLAGFFLFLAVALLVWRRNHIIDFGVSIPAIKPSDILIFMSALTAVVSLALSPAMRGNVARNTIALRWAGLLVLFLGFVGIGSVIATFVIGEKFTSEDAAEYVRLGFGMLFFLSALFLGYGEAKRTRTFALAFGSAVAMIPLIFIPAYWILKWRLVVSPASYVLQAFQPGPETLGSYLILPITLFFAFAAEGERRLNRYLSWCATFFLVVLLIWTTSRASWLGGFLGMVAIAIIAGWKKNSIRSVFVSTFVIGLLFVGALFLLSSPARNGALMRIFPELRLPTEVDEGILSQLPAAPGYLMGSADWPTFTTWLPTRYFFKVRNPVVEIGFQESRGEIWSSYAKGIARYPLGVGTGYSRIIGEEAVQSGVTPHSVWLQAAIAGGVGALIVLFYMLTRIVRGMYRAVRDGTDVYSLWASGALVGTLVNATFVDGLDLRWFWVILALAVLVYENHRLEVKAPSSSAEHEL